MPEGYWTTWLTTFLFFGAFYAVRVPLPLYLQNVGLPDWQISLILGAFGVGSLISRPFAGRLLDQHHRLRLLAAAFWIMLAGASGLAWASSQLPFLAASVCIAIASGILHPGLMALHVEQFSAAEQGRAASLFHVGFDLGIGLGAWCAAPVLQWADLTGFYALAACVQLVGLIMLRNFSKESGFASP